MAWPSPPKTWVSGDRGSSANLNAQLRDALMSGPNAGNLTALNTAVGTPAAGVGGILTAGTAGWDVPLWYDGSKWLSAPIMLLGNVSGTINSTTYQTLAAAIVPVAGNGGGGASGLLAYFRVRGFVQAASGSETTTVAISPATFVNLASEPATGTEVGAVTSAGATMSYLDTGYVNLTLSTGQPWWEAFIRIKSSNTTAGKTQSRFSLELQWRSV